MRSTTWSITFDSLFTNNCTINICVGYGEVGGNALGSGALGSSITNLLSALSYTSLRNALLAENAPGSSTLPTTSPLGGHTLFDSGRSKGLGAVVESTSTRRLCRIQQHSFVGLHDGCAVSRPILFDRHHRARNYGGNGSAIIDKLCAELLFGHGSLPLFGTGRAQCCHRRFG